MLFLKVIKRTRDLWPHAAYSSEIERNHHQRNVLLLSAFALLYLRDLIALYHALVLATMENATGNVLIID